MSDFQNTIQALLAKAEQTDDFRFRMLLEEAVKANKEEAVPLLSSLILSRQLSLKIRQNIIRSVGYLQFPTLLIPLKKTVDDDPNIQLKKEAVIAISKFNNQRALNLLNATLSNIRDPMLLGTINAEIGRIKQNNPILGLLPKFLEGSNNPKLHRISVQILKKIITPTDCQALLPYLNASDALIAEGAYEILCERAEVTCHSFLFGYFETHATSPVEIDTVVTLLTRLERFLSRSPELIPPRFPWLRQWTEHGDPRLLEIGLTILTASPDPQTWAYLRELYQQREELRLPLAEKMAPSPLGSTFLIGEFMKDPEGQRSLIPPLLFSEPGCRHLTGALPSFSDSLQQTILEAVPAEHYPLFRHHFHQALHSEDFPKQKAALAAIHRVNDFQARAVLFAAENEPLWQRVIEEYMQVTSDLFPVLTLVSLFSRPRIDPQSLPKFRRFLSAAPQILEREPVVDAVNKEVFLLLFRTLLGQASQKLIPFLLVLLKKMKTLDSGVYWNLQGALKLYLENRGDNLSAEEKNEIKKIRDEFNQIALAISRLNDETKRIAQFLSLTPPDFDALEGLVQSAPLSLTLHREEVLGCIRSALRSQNSHTVTKALQFLNRQPGFAAFLQGEFQGIADPITGPAQALLLDLRRSALPPPRFILRLEDAGWRNALMDQLTILFPEIGLVETATVLPSDLLCADAAGLREILAFPANKVGRIFLFLANAAEFAPYKELKPVSFLPPYSLNRVFKAVGKDFFVFPFSPPR